LQCLDGCWRRALEVARCSPLDYDSNYKMQWKCDGEFQPSYTWGNFEVDCEGYDFPGDEYIVEGSCALKYEIKHQNTSLGFWRKFAEFALYGFIGCLCICFLCLLCTATRGKKRKLF